MSALPSPDYARNMRIIGHSDQGGRPDGVQIMVHRGFAYVGHMFSKGWSIIDVRDPRNPRAVNYVPAPPGTWNIHLQAHDDLLLVVNAKDMFAAAEFADERAYYRGQVGQVVGTAQGSAGARAAYRALFESDGILLFIDEFERGRVYAPEFGRPRRVEGNLAFAVRLAKMAEAEIIPAYCLRRNDSASFDVFFLPPPKLLRTGTDQDALGTNYATLHAMIEPLIREHLDQWFYALDFEFDA